MKNTVEKLSRTFVLFGYPATWLLLMLLLSKNASPHEAWYQNITLVSTIVIFTQLSVIVIIIIFNNSIILRDIGGED